MNDQAIAALKALVETLTSQLTGTQGQIDAINAAITALQNGGAVAQAQIDQAVSDQVTAALTPVQTAVNSTLNTLANAKTPIVADPITPADPAPADPA